HIPVIVISADATSSQIEHLLRAGAEAYLTKPLDVTKFLKTFNETLALNLTPPTPDDTPISVPLQLRADPDVPSISSTLRILVVEDNTVNQQVVLHQLRLLGHEAVVVVDNGVSAVEAWQHGDFSVIFMDCNLPEMDGYEATREIRRREQQMGEGHIPIIALTATDSEADRNKCLDVGMDDYLAKPTRQSSFFEALQRWHPPVEDNAKTASPSEKEEPTVLRERWKELQEEIGISLLQDLAKLFLRDTPADLEALKAVAC
ncbi:MAG: response regulator, partial [Hymenobacter sp.]